MIRYEVGKPWSGLPELVAEPGFGWHAEAGLMLLVQPNLTDRERAGLGGPIDVAVLSAPGLVGLMVRPDGWDWQETLSWRRWPEIPAALRNDNGGSPDERLLLTLVVVDQATRIVERVRTFTLSPHATRVLRREVAYRWTEVTADLAGHDAVTAWYAAHPSPRDSLAASVARCKAGA